MSMIRNLALFGPSQVGASSAIAQEVWKRSIEPEGGFSLCVPEVWTASRKEGEKYKSFLAPPAETSTANISLHYEMSVLLPEDYATASVDYILKNYTQLGLTAAKALTRDSFTTKTGLVGNRGAFQVESKALFIRTIQYYFNRNPGQKLLLTCTLLEADQVTLVPICDRAAKTFHLEERANPPKEE